MNKSQTQDTLLCIIIVKPSFIFTEVRREVLYALVLFLILAGDGAVEKAVREKCCCLVKLFLHSCANLFHSYPLIVHKEISQIRDRTWKHWRQIEILDFLKTEKGEIIYLCTNKYLI